MELSIPTNWDNSLIDRVGTAPIRDFFGKLPSDYFGGGRPSLYIPSVRKRSLRKHIEVIHRHGYKFNYLLNASCLDNAEFSRAGQYRMHKFVDWLLNNGIDGVTVSIPYLVNWIKHNYPSLEIKASIIANIDSLSKAKQWESRGADSIVLELDCNRDFALLANIVKNIKCTISLVVNLACLRSCALSQYH
ncbi:MAG: U32 family peptidase, partial [Candidatus Omnitrophica bacterium]|nr:U32 family peptidase [Candidatus Omnitrophota bacterium]